MMKLAGYYYHKVIYLGVTQANHYAVIPEKKCPVVLGINVFYINYKMYKTFRM